MYVVSDSGIYEMSGLSDDDRSLIGQHHNAIARAMDTGRTDDYVNGQGKVVRGLDYFEGQQVQGVELATDLNNLYWMQLTGELDQGPYETL